jgi:hypothetical protein
MIQLLPSRRYRIRSCRPSGDSCQNSTRDGSTRKPPQRRGRGRSAPPGWRRSMSRTCVCRTVRLATTRLCHDAALPRGGRAETDGGGARTSVRVRFVLAYPLDRPATRTWRCTGTSQCSTAAARGFAASSAPLSLLAVGEEDQPPPQPAQHHQAGRRNTVAGGTGDGHGFGHRLAGRAGRIQPRSELTQRIGVQVCDIHPPSFAAMGLGC